MERVFLDVSSTQSFRSEQIVLFFSLLSFINSLSKCPALLSEKPAIKYRQ